MNNHKDNKKIEIKTRNSVSELPEYDPGSIWEHLLFGLGGVIFIIPPLLFPEVSNKTWVLGLFGTVIVFYIIICLLGIWKNLKRYKHYK